MEDQHREILRKNREVLRRELSADRLASDLYAAQIFDQEDVCDIQASNTPQKQADTLLELLVKRGPDAFPCFHKLLEKNSSSRHLANRLLPTSEMAVSDENFKRASLPCKQVNFIGRVQLCADLIDRTKEGHRLLAVTGLPGNGKSSVAIRVGHKLEKDGFTVLYFLLKEVTTVFAAADFILETLGQVVSQNPVKQLLNLLKSLTTKTLIILDNTENIQENESKKFLEFLEDAGKFSQHVITFVTTTEVLESLKDLPFYAESFPLEPLSEEESMMLFNKFISDVEIPSAKAKQLCKACMGIPLFLEIAASQVNQGNDVMSLLSELQASPQVLFQIEDIQQKMKVFLSRLPEDLKATLAYLAVFPTSFTSTEANNIFSNVGGMFNLNNKFGKLTDYTLLKFDKAEMTYELHNMVQSVCKARIDDFIHLSYRSAVTKFIDYYFNVLQELTMLFISPDSKLALERYTSHKRNIIHAMSLAVEYKYEPAIDVSTEVVNLLAKCMNIHEFEAIYLGLAQMAQENMDIKRYSDCLTSVGFKRLCYHGKDNAEEAFAVLSEACRLQVLTHNVGTEERAHCLSKLGLCYTRLGDIEIGVKMIVEGIIIRKKNYQKIGGNIKEMLVYGGFCDLAMALSTNNHLKAAVNIWEAICLKGYRKIMGNHPFTATLLQYIGDAHHKLGRFVRALEYKKEALAMRKHLLTAYHQDTARSCSSFAHTLEKLGRSAEAIEMLEDTRVIQAKVCASPEDINTTDSEIRRLREQDVSHTLGRCNIHSNREAHRILSRNREVFMSFQNDV